MFNEETKTLFLDELQTEDLKRMYLSIFNRSASYETELDKDISQFNLKECMSLLVELNPKSIGHVGSLKSQFNKYVGWAIDNNFASKNYWGLVPIDDDFAKFAFASRYIKDVDELTNIIEVGLSAVYDKYLICLLFMGIMGRNYIEVSLLKDKDVNIFNNTITTIRMKYNSIVKPLLDLVMTGGGYWEETKVRDKDSLYFIKPFKTKRKIGEPTDHQYVYRVFQKLNENISSSNLQEKKHFTPMTIWRSGMFYSLYQIEQTKGSLVSDDYTEVSTLYGCNTGFSTFLREYELYKEVFWG